MKNKQAVNISFSFIIRAKCKKCGSGPSWHYSMSTSVPKGDVRKVLDHSRETRKYIARMIDDWIMELGPSKLTHRNLKFHLSGRAFNPAYQKNRRTTSFYEAVEEVAICHCGGTQWIYKTPPLSSSPEIRNRKGRYNYPNEFEFEFKF